MSKIYCLIALVVTSTLLAGCRTHSSTPEATAAKPMPSQSLAHEWVVNLPIKGGQQITSVHLLEKYVVAYSSQNLSHVIDRKSGQLLSISQVANPQVQLRAPLMYKESILYPTNVELEQFSPKGSRERVVDVGVRFSGNLVSLGSRIYGGISYAPGGRVVAIDPDAPVNQVRWELMTKGAVVAAPAVFRGQIFFGDELGRIYGVSELREKLWSLEGGVFLTYGRIMADLQADEYGVYIASLDSKLYCVSRDTGKVKWQYFASQALITTPVVMEDLVYQASDDGVAAISKTEGEYNRKALWLVKDAVQVLSEDEDFVYLRRRDSVVVAANKKTGEIEFQSRRADFAVFTTNTSGDGIVYGATKTGQVMAIKPVLKAGFVGEMVLVPIYAEPLASAE